MFSVKYFVPRPGLEPGCFTAADFKSAGSDLNFPTEAYFIIYITNIQINIDINKFLMNFFSYMEPSRELRLTRVSFSPTRKVIKRFETRKHFNVFNIKKMPPRKG